MAYFGRKPEKPGSLPGAGSGAREAEARQRVRGAVERLERRLEAGRPARQARQGTPVRAARNGRTAR